MCNMTLRCTIVYLLHQCSCKCAHGRMHVYRMHLRVDSAKVSPAPSSSSDDDQAVSSQILPLHRLSGSSLLILRIDMI